jgi:hypothetical protein
MEFLMYLTPVGREIITGVMNKNYNVLENASICRNKQIFGVVQSPNFIICLNNIKNSVSPVKHYVNETVYHEAVHVAQSCKRSPLGIRNATLDYHKLNDVSRSVSLIKSYPVFEVEAYYLEDKPEKVLGYLKKYCF